MRVFTFLTLSALAIGNSIAAWAAAPSGGPYSAPLAAAYADLTNAATRIVNDNGLSGTTIVIYDAQTIATLSSYQSAVEQLRSAMTKLCPASSGGFTAHVVPSLDVGGAASGLAALLQAVTPAYSIQGQSITFDNTALIAAFARAAGNNVIFPAYLSPAAKHDNILSCEQSASSLSVADLWFATAKAASDLVKSAAAAPNEAAKKPLQDKLDAFQKVSDSFIASDKGPSTLSKLLIAESLLRQIPDKSTVKVIDLKLDSVGIDSTVKTVLFWKSTQFTCTVMAHYTLMNLSKDGTVIDLKPYKTDSVIILSKVKDADKFGTSVDPAGLINGGAGK